MLGVFLLSPLQKTVVIVTLMLELNISWSCESSGIPHILFRHGPVTVTTMSPGNAPLLGQHGGLLIQEDATLTGNAWD